MGILYSYHRDDSGDYEETSGHGRNRRTVGRRGDVDYTRERNVGTGPPCAVLVVAGLASLAAAAPAAAQALHDSVGAWL